MPRYKDALWSFEPSANGTLSWEAIHAALLMDIRDELQKINAAFPEVPRRLRTISAKIPPRRKPKR